MTISRTIAEKTVGGYTFTACEVYEKFNNIAHYEIITSKDGLALYVDRAARTTWKKKFNSMTKEA